MELEILNIEVLRSICPEVYVAEEAGKTYIGLPNLVIWNGEKVNALLCPTSHTGYSSRLFFSKKVATKGVANKKPNWNFQGHRILGETWWAVSWKIEERNLSLCQLLLAHVRGIE